MTTAIVSHAPVTNMSHDYLASQSPRRSLAWNPKRGKEHSFARRRLTMTGEETPVEEAAPETEELLSDPNSPDEEMNVRGTDEPVAAEKKDETKTNTLLRWFKNSYEYTRLPTQYRLVSERSALEKSLGSVRFTVMASAINTKLLNPNYPIMATPGGHPDSFPDTEPFDFNSATYFLPMCSILGVAIASVFLGQISDRIGRKRVILTLAWISTVGSVVKYFCTNTFWSFCASQFVFGFFLGNLPVAMAYIGDVATSKRAKEKELGMLVSYYVMGNSGGGIIAILMNDNGLFVPLLVGAGILGIAALNTSWNMIEAGDVRLKGAGFEIDEDEEEDERPETIDNKALINIVMGAVADNFGSTGLFPMCLSPLAFEKYFLDFVGAVPPEEPIMSLTGYQWLSVLVAVMVVPSTLMTPSVFRSIGVAGTCVFGNLMTALVTLALLLVGNADATKGWFIGFVFIMYSGFPFTVFSQLTTGPMLDAIAPESKVGYVQGLNNAAMNFGMAIAPWLFGLLADATNTNTAIIVGISISCSAAAINFPLTFDKRFGKGEVYMPLSQTLLKDEDPDFVEKALAGDIVDQEEFFLVNLNRLNQGKPPLVPRVKPYKEEKDLGEIGRGHHVARPLFEARTRVIDKILLALNDPSPERSPEEICEMINKTHAKDASTKETAIHDLGEWIGEYLADAGYNPHMHSTTIKQMIQTALPPISFEKEINPENLEASMIRTRQVLGHYVDASSSSRSRYTFEGTMGKGQAAVFY